MKVFVTGATGYLGSAIADRLVQKGHAVTGLARTEEAEERLRARRITPVRGNLDEPALLTRFAQQAEAVVHSAFQWGADVTSTIHAEHGVVTALLAGVQRTDKPFIFTSGTSVLGDTGSEVYDESTLIPPHHLNQRLDTEQLVLQAADAHGIVIRPPNVYGRGDGQALFAALRNAGKSFKAVPYAEGTGNKLWSFVHVDDLADLYELALVRSASHQLFHAGAESGLCTQAIAAALSQGMGWDGRTVQLSLDKMKLMFPVPALAEYWARNSQSSRTKAESLLGWKPEHVSMLSELEFRLSS